MQGLKGCMGWSLSNTAAKQYLEFKVCYNGKVSKKDWHHLVTFYSIYFLFDDRFKNTEPQYSYFCSCPLPRTLLMSYLLGDKF